MRLAAPGCKILRDDSGGGWIDPWGAYYCQSSSRIDTISGDSYPTTAGLPQASSLGRRLSVFDGDDVFGERCELARNSHIAGTFALYREGQHKLTFASLRLPSGYPLTDSRWQLVMQMKQTQPSANGDGTPVLSLHASGGRWRLLQSASRRRSTSARGLWSTSARIGQWTRFAFDVHYSQNPDRGSVKLYVDLNGDGDAADPGEQSPLIRTYTLKRETSGRAGDRIAPGESIPSHLRVGTYHDTAVRCPVGCPVDVDNVQVIKAF